MSEMKGSRHIRVSNRKLSYEFTIWRNLTIIRGNSATGKTTLIGMIREFNLQGEDSGVQVTCSSPCVVVEGQSWEKQLKELDEDSIVFIDEGNRFVSSQRFAEVVEFTVRESTTPCSGCITNSFGFMERKTALIWEK